MKKLPTSQEVSSRGSSAPWHEARTVSKNPVVLALHRIDQSQPQTGRHAPERFRIANEILQHLGWPEAETSISPDGAAMQAFTEQYRKDQVKRTCAELQAYLHRSEGEEDRRANHPHPEPPRLNPHLPNPVLAAFARSHS
jgi:hypothetical protein